MSHFWSEINRQEKFIGLHKQTQMVSQPIQAFEYEFPGDEIFQILQGNLQVAISDGDIVDLREGDIVSFNKGLKSTWTIQSSFKKFFVISNC